MEWHIPDRPEAGRFESEGAAIARAWELTPAGGRRPEVDYIASDDNLVPAPAAPPSAPAPGTGIRICGEVLAEDGLPSMAEVGDGWLVHSTGEMMVWVGSRWVDAGRLQIPGHGTAQRMAEVRTTMYFAHGELMHESALRHAVVSDLQARAAAQGMTLDGDLSTMVERGSDGTWRVEAWAMARGIPFAIQGVNFS